MLIYFSESYLEEYFIYIFNFLSKSTNLSQMVDVDLACPYHLKHANAKKILFEDLKYQDYEYVWVTSDLLPYVRSSAIKICSNHHAGYGESIFLPNYNVMNHADVLFCALFDSAQTLDTFNYFCKGGVKQGKQRELLIVPIGYPKLDSMIERYQELKVEERGSILLFLTSSNDLKYNIGFVLHEVVNQLLTLTGLNVCIRVLPADRYKSWLVELLECKRFSGRVKLSEGSYLPDLVSSKYQVFFGRRSLTSAYTCAFTTNKPVIFFDPLNEKTLEKIDIGVVIRDKTELGRAIKEIESIGSQEHLISSISKYVQNLNQSMFALERFFSCYFAGKQSFVEHYPSIGRVRCSTFNQRHLDSLLKFDCLVAKNSIINDSSYAIVDYLKNYVTEVSEADLYQITKFLFDSRLQLKFLGQVTILELVFRRYESLNIQVPVDVQSKVKGVVGKIIGIRSYRQLDKNYSDTLLSQVFFLSKSLYGDSDLNFLYNLLVCSGKYEIVSRLIDYAEQKNCLNYPSLLTKYFRTAPFWDVEVLESITVNKKYSLFGLGSSSKRLIRYLRYHNFSLPCFVFGDRPSITSIEGIEVRDTSLINDYHYDVVIVSALGFKDITTRMVKMGIPKKKFVTFASL